MKRKPKLKIVGRDGNAFAILGAARRAASSAGMPENEWKEYETKATAGDYDNLLAVTMEYFDVE